MSTQETLKLFAEIVEAVEENNRINDAKWKDWYDIYHILSAYELRDKFRVLSAGEKILLSVNIDECISANCITDAAKILL